MSSPALIPPAQDIEINPQLDIILRTGLAIGARTENLLILKINNILVTVSTGLQTHFFAKPLVKHNLQKVISYLKLYDKNFL